MDLIIPVNGEKLIRDAFSPKEMSTMVSVVSQGYKLARGAIRHISFLGWDIGKRHEGYLRPIAINYLMRNEVKSGNLPFELSIESNSNKSHKFALFSKGPYKVTLSQVNLKGSIGRHAFYKEKLQLVNQVSMGIFQDEVHLYQENEYYFLLTYSSGGTKPQFINLGVPNGEKKCWHDKINLLNEPHVISSNTDSLDEEEVITTDNLIGLRQFAEEVEVSGN